MERANILKCKLNSFCRSGGWQGRYFKDAVAAVWRLMDCYPQALYSVGIDLNKLEIVLSNIMADGGAGGGRG